MKKLTILIASCFITTFVYANDPSDNNDLSPDKKEIRQLHKDVNALHNDVRKLEALIVQMQDTLDAYQKTLDTYKEASSHDQPHKERDADNKWACFMNDLSAGGIVGTGRTEAEAKGRALESCTQKRGTCWEQKLQCSSDEPSE